MFKIATLVVAAFIAATVLYQGIARIPADALTVALGVACGLGASIPVMIGLLVALLRQREEQVYEGWRDAEPLSARVQSSPVSQRIAQPHAPHPQIIVVAPPQGQFAPVPFPGSYSDLNHFSDAPPWWNGQFSVARTGEQTVDARDWRIIGEE